jgi:hypothetical protein
VHSEFGHCANEEFRFVSEHVPGTSLQHVPQEPPYYIVISTYIRWVPTVPRLCIVQRSQLPHPNLPGPHPRLCGATLPPESLPAPHAARRKPMCVLIAPRV